MAQREEETLERWRFYRIEGDSSASVVYLGPTFLHEDRGADPTEAHVFMRWHADKGLVELSAEEVKGLIPTGSGKLGFVPPRVDIAEIAAILAR